MNRIIFVSLALCLVVAPALSLPAEKHSEKLEDFGDAASPTKHPDENEVNGTVNRDTEKVGSSESEPEPDSGSDENTNVAVSSVNGQIQGVIEHFGVTDKFHCRKITCPPLTVRCEFNSKYSGSGKTLDVLYKCKDKNGTVIQEKTETESIEEATNFGLPDISDMFKRFDDFMKTMFSGPFWGVDRSIEDDAE